MGSRPIKAAATIPFRPTEGQRRGPVRPQTKNPRRVCPGRGFFVLRNEGAYFLWAFFAFAGSLAAGLAAGTAFIDNSSILAPISEAAPVTFV